MLLVFLLLFFSKTFCTFLHITIRTDCRMLSSACKVKSAVCCVSDELADMGRPAQDQCGAVLLLLWGARRVCAVCVSGLLLLLLLFVGRLTSQQHASVSQGRICSDNFMCCHTDIEVAEQTLHLTQLQYTDTKPASPSADPIMPGAWQGSHWSANFEVTGMT